MNPYETLGRILGVEAKFLEGVDHTMAERTGKMGVMAHVAQEIENASRHMLIALGVTMAPPKANEVRAALQVAIERDEAKLRKVLEDTPGENEFEKAANLSRKIVKVGKGFFLKKSFGEEILTKNRPDNLLKFLGYGGVDEMLKHHDVTEIFSALRFIESEQWMHETFEKAYGGFTAADFEEREIEIKVLGTEWREVAQKFVAKKHHNVSHLKEFGIIFLNPIREDAPGKYLRDFALLFHYFHEVEFYSKMFRHYAPRKDFAARFKSLLRGDLPKRTTVSEGEWLIMQRYLAKENPKDPRLFLPRVNPESIHWFRGERDLADFGAAREDIDLELWRDLDWVAGIFNDGTDPLVSFDLEDNAMSTVSALEGKTEHWNYHQREALWTRLFLEYAGSEEAMERLLVEHFEKNTVQF